jgi:nicotinamidase-related amidase
MRDALLVLDVISEFRHPDGEELRASLAAHRDVLASSIADARERGIPVVYVNDANGEWGADVGGRIRRAVDAPGGHVLEPLVPRPDEPFLLKPRYSAFDHTALELLLREHRVERILLAGAATEMCVLQTAIAARECGLKVTILAGACASVDERDAELALAYAERIAGAYIERGDTPVPDAC